MDQEERILNKLDEIERRGVDTLIAVTEIKGQIRDIPELKEKVAALERFRWLAVGALATGGTSLGAQVINLLGK